MARLACVIVSLSLSALAGAADLQRIDLSSTACEVVSITDQAVTIATDAGEETIPRDGVSEIVLSPDLYDPQADPMRLRGKAVLVTINGDVLPVNIGELADGALSFDNPVTGTRQVAMERVSAIYMPAAGQQAHEIAAACREMEMHSGSTDCLLVSQEEGGYLQVRGALRTIADETGRSRARKAQKTVTFTWQEADREIPLKDVRAILLAGANADVPAPRGYIIGALGTKIGFTSISLEGDKLAVESPAFGSLSLTRDIVEAIRFVSPRVVHLAELTPSAVASHGMVTDAMEYRRDRSVGGGPISLDGMTYATGLGLHSFTELTYELDGEFSTFAAVVGIDDSVRPNGEATVTILSAGGEQRDPIVLTVTGQGPAEIVRCDLTGASELTIRVDFGDDELGVADHVDLAAARLIK